jgi:hypothetical protein
MLRVGMCPLDPGKAVVETPPAGEQDDLSRSALRQRIRQQELLSELGVLALQGTSFVGMLDHTVRMTAEGLNAEYCKVLEYKPSEKRLLVRAGVGWDDGVVGYASVGADLESPAGFALHTGKPVISNHLENEDRFRTPELLVEHGIRRAGTPSVVITDERLVPPQYWEPRDPRLNRQSLAVDLKAGQSIDGAVLGNPEPVLSVRVK